LAGEAEEEVSDLRVERNQLRLIASRSLGGKVALNPVVNGVLLHGATAETAGILLLNESVEPLSSS
jgi:hypothetical protein